MFRFSLLSDVSSLSSVLLIALRDYDPPKLRSLFPISDVTPFGLRIALWSWDYDPLFVALRRDHDPRFRLLQTLLGTDHIRLVSLFKVGSDPHPPRFHEHL